MNKRTALAVVPLCLLCAACDKNQTPTQPTTPLTAQPHQFSPPSQAVVLGEVVEVALDTTVGTGGTYCEIGGDPAPCARFDIDVPRAGTLVIRLEFETAQPMFIYLYRYEPAVLGGVVDLQNVDGDQSPLVARHAVERGMVYLHTGLNVPWGHRDAQVLFRLLATLE